jgi:hypothetical protein
MPALGQVRLISGLDQTDYFIVYSSDHSQNVPHMLWHFETPASCLPLFDLDLGKRTNLDALISVGGRSCPGDPPGPDAHVLVEGRYRLPVQGAFRSQSAP